MVLRASGSVEYDCVVSGSCVVDIFAGPVSLATPLGVDALYPIDPVRLTTGGIVSNSGIALARMGQRVAALTYLGDDELAGILRSQFEVEGIDTSHLRVHPSRPTSASVVLVNEDGEHCFAHCQGAPAELDRKFLCEQSDLFQNARIFLLGYYSLLPKLEPDLPGVLAWIQDQGCQTALDSAGSGGTMQPLDRILPHLDYYVPSYREAVAQTNASDPMKIIDVYRQHGATGVVGVKLGSRGALLSSPADERLRIEPVTPPGPVVDTTGAGDSFYAGLLTGLMQGYSLADAGRIGAAAGACCVSAAGASTGALELDETIQLAGVTRRS